MINKFKKIPNSKSYILNSCKAFTLVELLVTISLLAIVATISGVNFFNHKNKTDLNLAGQKLTSVLQETRQKSISQEGGERWGIRLTNDAEANDYYEVFHGTEYSASHISLKNILGTSMNFTTPLSGTTMDIIFLPISGQIDATTTTTISSNITSAGTYTIVVNQNGKISGGMD